MIKTISLSGNYGDIGYAHGQHLKENIHKTVDYYLHLFDLPDNKLKIISDKYRQVISKQATCYIDEIEAIAEGADIEPWYIYALNARSEILTINASECTSLYVNDGNLLAQNWDWAERFESLLSVIHIDYGNGHKITTLTEPGMLAKIGFNSAGIGVCLNILQSEITTYGLPVHLCLRMALDSADFSSAEQKLTKATKGKASHILLADDQNNCIGLEYKDNNLFKLKPASGSLVHTNHYLAVDDSSNTMPATRERLLCAQSLVSQLDNTNVDKVLSILLDNSCGEDSILQSYREIEELKTVAGTVVTVVMDLKKRHLYYKLGSTSTDKISTITMGA